MIMEKSKEKILRSAFELVKRGIDAVNEDGETPMILAARAGDLNVVNALIKQGANVDVQVNDVACTALIVASREGFIDIVGVLLKAGADMDTQDHLGCTALDWAEELKHQDIVDLLKTEKDRRISSLSEQIIATIKASPPKGIAPT